MRGREGGRGGGGGGEDSISVRKADSNFGD